jgi:starvation-inducible DNA-binding protein
MKFEDFGPLGTQVASIKSKPPGESIMATKTAAPKSAVSKTSASKASNNGFHASADNQPVLRQRGRVIQEYGTVRNIPIGLEASARKQIVDGLNQVLADTIMLSSMYKKHHWQVSGHTFYQLHLLFDKHYEEQSALIDTIAERIQILGGVATGMPAAVAKMTKIENPPEGVEEVPVQISRLLEAHEVVITESRELADKASELGDEGTNDVLISDVVRTNELQVWFVSSHLVDEPLVHAGSVNDSKS